LILTTEVIGKYKITEQITHRAVVVEDLETSKILLSFSFLTSGIDEARMLNGNGILPNMPMKALDTYMSSRGFKRCKWERRLSDGTLKTVNRKIKRQHENF